MGSTYQGKFCAEDVDYDTSVALLTCPVADACPGGGVEEHISVSLAERYSGFSDSWGWYKYLSGDICKFRVFAMDEGNLVLELDKIDEDVNQATLMIMQRDTWEYPVEVEDLTVADEGKVWNVSALTYEYWLYFMPSYDRAGSYRVNVELEPLWDENPWQADEPEDETVDESEQIEEDAGSETVPEETSEP